jgi:hypothetical protein
MFQNQTFTDILVAIAKKMKDGVYKPPLEQDRLRRKKIKEKKVCAELKVWVGGN